MSTPTFHWYLPTTTDNRNLVPNGLPDRVADLPYMADVARAAERNGFDSILLPAGENGQDAWVIASALIAATSRLRFLVAMRTGYIAPPQAAMMATTFDQLSGGRIALNIITGGYEGALAGFGDKLPKDERYRRTAEFMQVLRLCWTGKPFRFEGEYFDLDNPGIASVPSAPPALFFGGSSEAGLEAAAAHADVHLIYGELPDAAARHAANMRERAARNGRRIELGIRIQVIARRRHEDAWRDAEALLDDFDEATVARRQAQLAERNSVGQRNVQSLNNGRIDREALRVYPTIWAGTGLVAGGGSSTALVGSYDEVAERIRQYHEVGIDHFILSGFPRLESAYEVGEGILPFFKQDRAPLRAVGAAR